MSNYYEENLNSVKLFQVYQTKYQRIKRYFNEEIVFIQKNLSKNDKVLEIGAGYGRIIKELGPFSASVVGIDISQASVDLGKDYIKECTNCEIKVMDAYNLEFSEEDFDVVLCLQNGLSAIKGESTHLINECLKVLKPGGKAYFSTYSDKFWEHRLAWFQEQADNGLLGEIDFEKTKNGMIACKDGFVSTSFSKDELIKLGELSGCQYYIEEVDEASIFLIIEKPN
ncbi:2-polyprenyl-6-hydroxyphenyl methylase/3-demethylubiquinone-9 3-methyltransferase [Sedimentibacter acidaminivorans]|uniref:2-polyprenyl-6-hydroxyphenyl methylase/3-demethylubiquinone-9 3-methyltransferase n=1 Tax=Sedimentibacter acidaminivorans TaxID=913099 RepID=A0ABS4GCF3_9FIRM|nr:class I SAM-dependent methyltransferase [Sedimentibacter acidaminivorans]MBP1925378.1 2-polyprenyl-6-hydroxyphenyl methylase/3-demethylubiquinone-9 3-methyltransferase [Sedimentibacter acidaminivorans]